ncbi:hypothetical protein [Saccharopolyspora rosea]|uniref:Uncharacterized protein n=1 Tax=Saccharopolyspora rosea TaxID=524884 RepID=A0ABW3G050_9PSEU|nr:hypothetical protein [Saccharopolyspora rosea]
MVEPSNTVGGVSAFLRRHIRAVSRLAVFAALPAVLLLVLSLVSGLVRTTALGVFGVVALLRVLMVALDRLGEAAPTPRLSWEVAR